MSSIVDALLLLAEVRKAEVRVEPLNMEHIVTEATQRLTHVIGEAQAEITLPDSWPVRRQPGTDDSGHGKGNASRCNRAIG